MQEAGLDRLIRAGYGLLDLVTFFTAGPKETRAWTVTRGAKAPQAAGVIHTDFEQGFIRAETIAYVDYVAGGGEAGAREAGKMRLEGKDYVVAGRRRHALPLCDLIAVRAMKPQFIVPGRDEVASRSVTRVTPGPAEGGVHNPYGALSA